MEKSASTGVAARTPGPSPEPEVFRPLGMPPMKSGVTKGPSRNFLGNRFVYAMISQRARGLSIGVNLNPDKLCNFACAYCEVNRQEPATETQVQVGILAVELRRMLAMAQGGQFREVPAFQSVPSELLQLKEVALSGEGEPTLCPNFAEVVQTVVHLRAQRVFPFFKIVLITNGTGLHLPQVQQGLRLLTGQDEVWAKLDAGTQEYMDRINRPRHGTRSGSVSLVQVMDNILALARQRPVIIQSLFPLLNGEEPPADEIEQYVLRLRELKEGNGQISLVQVYSAHRAAIAANIGHLPLKSLSRIAQRVRESTGLKAEVF